MKTGEILAWNVGGAVGLAFACSGPQARGCVLGVVAMSAWICVGLFLSRLL